MNNMNTSEKLRKVEDHLVFNGRIVHFENLQRLCSLSEDVQNLVEIIRNPWTSLPNLDQLHQARDAERASELLRKLLEYCFKLIWDVDEGRVQNNLLDMLKAFLTGGVDSNSNIHKELIRMCIVISRNLLNIDEWTGLLNFILNDKFSIDENNKALEIIQYYPKIFNTTAGRARLLVRITEMFQRTLNSEYYSVKVNAAKAYAKLLTDNCLLSLPSVRLEHDQLPSVRSEHDQLPSVRSEHYQLPSVRSEHHLIPSERSRHDLLPYMRFEHDRPYMRSEHDPPYMRCKQHQLPSVRSEHDLLPSVPSEHDLLQPLNDFTEVMKLSVTTYFDTELLTVAQNIVRYFTKYIIGDPYYEPFRRICSSCLEIVANTDNDEQCRKSATVCILSILKTGWAGIEPSLRTDCYQLLLQTMTEGIPEGPSLDLYFYRRIQTESVAGVAGWGVYELIHKYKDEESFCSEIENLLLLLGKRDLQTAIHSSFRPTLYGYIQLEDIRFPVVQQQGREQLVQSVPYQGIGPFYSRLGQRERHHQVGPYGPHSH